jgi:hypothetical protein
MDDTLQASPTVKVGQAMPAGQLSSLLALSGHLRPGSQLFRHLKEKSSSPTPRRQTSSLLTVFAKCPEPTTMKLMLLNHRFSIKSTTIQRSKHIKTSMPQQERYQTQEEKVIF